MKFCGVFGKYQNYNFGFHKENFKHLDELKDYANGSKLYDIFMYGEAGHGKTGLAISIIRNLIQRGCESSKLFYITENDYKNKLISLNNDHEAKEQFLNKIKTKNFYYHLVTYAILIRVKFKYF